MVVGLVAGAFKGVMGTAKGVTSLAASILGNKASASTLRHSKAGKEFLTRRVLPAAVAYGAGKAGSFALQTRAEERRAYYGEKAYSSRYGTSAETAAGITQMAGSAIGVGALLGVTPSIRRRFEMRGINKGLRKVEKEYKAVNSRIGAIEQRTRPFKADYFGNRVGGSSVVRTPLAPQGASKSFLADYASMTSRRTALMTEKSALQARKSAIGPMMSAKAMLGYGAATAIATSAASGVIGDPIGSLVTGVGVVLGAKTLFTPIKTGKQLLGAGKFVVKNIAPIGAGVATIATGAAIGANIPAPAAAEGTIEEAVYNKSSPIQKLNYSTAGLVQAIHNNRRMR
jgi:hypothetical protein